MIKFPFGRSEFYRNVLTMMSGTVIAQLIPVALSPILSRIYSPEEFGFLSLFSSIAAVAAVVATFRYELAIMLPEKDEYAINVLAIAFAVTCFLTVLSGVVILFFGQTIASLFRITQLHPYLLHIPLFLAFAGGTQALNYWISRQKKFKLLAAGKIGQTGTTSVLSIILGLMNFHALGLIMSAVAGQVASFFIFLTASAKKIVQMSKHVSYSEIRENVRRYNTFMFVNTPHALLGMMQDLIVVFLINHFFSSTILGWYAFGFRILKVPSAFIGSAVYQVYFQQASGIRNNMVKLQEMTKNIYIQMGLAGLPVFIVTGLFAPYLFSWIFGRQWIEAGHIAQILSPWLFLNFIIGPIAALTIVLNKQQWAIWFSVVDTFLRSVAIIIGGWFENYQLAFILLSAGSSCLLIYALYWFYHLPMRIKIIEYGVH